MATHINITLCSSEIYQQVQITEQDLIDIVSHGIVRPQDMQAQEWQFEEQVVTEIARAARLRRDLQINWAGVALALELIEELEALRKENQELMRRLQRLEE